VERAFAIRNMKKDKEKKKRPDFTTFETFQEKRNIPTWRVTAEEAKEIYNHGFVESYCYY